MYYINPCLLYTSDAADDGDWQPRQPHGTTFPNLRDPP